ncbi:carboxymuconolactone decarboxylase family protein, partial [Jatrophihabitans sp.]|uniref:carboxymuconolactone decarboxylase family protein n=1 Tax=Jatrophihabitans sp. TaxID=1932789 RepID=UPI0030C71C67
MKAQVIRNQKQALSIQQQSITTISALTAIGDMENLSTQLNAGLDAGLTVEETKEILVQLYAYCGFPRSLNGISTLMAVMEKRKANGINDKQGKPAISKKVPEDKYEQGRKVLEALTKTPQSKPAPGFGEFAPRIDAFLKEHLFADIFESEVLTFQQRELVTISALAAMPGVASQLQSHVKMGINTGITENQLVEVADLIEKFVSKTQANALRKIIAKPAVPVVEPGMLVRISEIEILPEHLTEYNAILKEEAAASVEKEPGVLAIFPMSIKEQLTQIRIVEIYADSAAYQSHLKAPHFQHYK